MSENSKGQWTHGMDRTLQRNLRLFPLLLFWTITNSHLLFVMGALILQRAQKCEVRQVTKDVVKSEV